MTDKAPAAGRPFTSPPHRRAPSVELRALLSAIICLAQELLATVHTLPHLDIVRRFGSLNYKLIIARMTRGLMMAEALDDRVARTATRIDNPPLPRPAARTPASAVPTRSIR